MRRWWSGQRRFRREWPAACNHRQAATLQTDLFTPDRVTDWAVASPAWMTPSHSMSFYPVELMRHSMLIDGKENGRKILSSCPWTIDCSIEWVIDCFVIVLCIDWLIDWLIDLYGSLSCFDLSRGAERLTEIFVLDPFVCLTGMWSLLGTRMPLMDLLVHAAAVHHFNPSEYAVYNPNARFQNSSLPNTPVGELGTEIVQIVPKNSTVLHTLNRTAASIKADNERSLSIQEPTFEVGFVENSTPKKYTKSDFSTTRKLSPHFNN